MAEFNVKTIGQLQQLQLTGQNDRLDGDDYIVVYETSEGIDKGTTNKVSLKTLKDLTLANQTAIGADSTFQVQEENKNLLIGKKSVIVPTEKIDEYFNTNGISLKIKDNDSVSRITRIDGDGVDLSDTTLTISQLPPSIQITDGNNSFDVKDKNSSLKFTGAVSIDSNTGEIHINDKDTVLQAITDEHQEGINISKIAKDGNITFNTSSLSDGSTLLTIGLEGASSATKAFSLKAYDAFSSNSKDFTCSDINSLPEDSIVAIHFITAVNASPTTLNGYEIRYQDQFGQSSTNVNRIIQNYAILQKQSGFYNVIFADALQALAAECIVNTSQNFPVVNVDVNTPTSQSSFSALTPQLFEDNQNYIKPDYIRNLQSASIGKDFELSYDKLVNPSTGTHMIPKEYIPDGTAVVIDGNTVEYNPQELIFTNAESMVIPGGGEGGGSSSSSSKLIKAESLSGYDETENNFILKNTIAFIDNCFYLIKFVTGLDINAKRGLKFQTQNGQYSKYIYYNGTSSEDSIIAKNLIQDNDSILFYYDGTYFRYIANDNAVGDRVLINKDINNNVITLEQNGRRYEINQADFSAKTLNTNTSKFINIDDNNTSISIDFILSDNQNPQDLFLRGDGEWSTPSFTPLLPPETAPAEEENPEEYDRSNLFLDGDGEWSPVINNNLRLYLMDLLFPEGSIFYTTDPNFRPEEPTITESNIHIGNLNEPNYTWQQIGTTTQGGKTVYLWEKVKNNNQQAG